MLFQKRVHIYIRNTVAVSKHKDRRLDEVGNLLETPSCLRIESCINTAYLPALGRPPVVFQLGRGCAMRKREIVRVECIIVDIFSNLLALVSEKEHKSTESL